MASPDRLRRLVVALVLLSGCSLVESSNPTLDEGAHLEVIDYGVPLPTSRSGYAGMATFVTPGGAIQIVDPGSGPSDPPRLLRTIRLAGNIANDAQIADDGYLWIAPPDSEGGTLRVVYVVDPHTGTVHRTIETPENLNAIAGLSVGPDAVYLWAWRNGFQGALGSVSRACASDARACNVTVLAEFATVGLTFERALHYERGSLYTFSQGSTEAENAVTARIDPRTGREIASYPFSGTSTFDADHFYVMVLRAPGRLDLVRLDKETLQEEASQTIGINSFQIAHQSGKLYVTDGIARTVEVYDAVSLQRTETIDATAAGTPEAGVGFLAPGVLMLSHHAWLNTETEQVVAQAFPLQESFSQALRLPEGHPYAF